MALLRFSYGMASYKNELELLLSRNIVLSNWRIEILTFIEFNYNAGWAFATDSVFIVRPSRSVSNCRT
jgi:hypothetical protein